MKKRYSGTTSREPVKLPSDHPNATPGSDCTNFSILVEFRVNKGNAGSISFGIQEFTMLFGI